MKKDETCCSDYLASSRRSFLRGGLGGAAALTVAFGGTFSETAYAADGTADRVLVVISMRGAVDGMSIVVPHGDPIYYQARPGISIPASSLLGKDGFFGFHPNMAPLMPLWDAGKLAAIQATGQQVTTRSHFAAMEEVEDANPGSATRAGWLNRLVGIDGSGSPVEAIQFGGGPATTAMVGAEPVLIADDVDGIALSGVNNEQSALRRRGSLAKTWDGVNGQLGFGVRSAITVDEDFAPARAMSATPANGAVYPVNSDLANALKSASRTIKADIGAEVITVDHGSWDYHTDLGGLTNGQMRGKIDDFAKSIAAFFQDLGPLADSVTVITLSEFGRRVKENANRGLDHGHGNVMLAMGAGVKGGQYYGTWPGLQNSTDADLNVTTDYRSVLAEVTTKRFNASSSVVFPGFTPENLGFMS